MSATVEQQLADLRRANETFRQERDAALAELRERVDQAAVIGIEIIKAENEELRAAQAAGLEVLQAMAGSPGETKPVFELIARQTAMLCQAPIAMVGMFDGALVHLVTQSGFDDAYTEVFANQFPRPATADFAMGRAILSGRIEEIEDTGTADRNVFRPPPGPGSALAVPMMRNGVPLGVISVGRRVIGPFPRSQITLLRTFAEQAVIAITSSQTFRLLAQRNSEYGERIEHQSATIDVLKAMAASPGDAQPVLDLITRRARDLCDAPSVALFQYDGEFVYVRSECGTVPRSGRDALEAYKSIFPMAPTRASISCRAILEREIIHIRDVAKEPGLLSAVRDLRHRSNLAVPLMRDDVAIGAVTLASWDIGGFSDSQVELMKTFAEQAVIAITSAETYRALQVQTTDLEESLKYQTATADVLSVISRSAFDLQPVLESLVTTAANLCDAEMAAIIRCEGSLFRLIASRGFPADFVTDRYARGPMQARAASVTGRAARERRVIHIHDVAAEPDYPEDSIAVGKQRSSLGVPLLREGNVVGVILLARQRVEPFTDRQIDLVRTFADQAVIAMENARLLDELHKRSTDLQESLDYQTAISDVLRVISGSTFDLEPVFGTVAATAVQLCHAHQAGIYLRQDDEYRWAGGSSQLPDYERIEREVRIHPGTGTLVGRVALEGRAVQILDAWTDALYEAKEDARVGAIHTLLGVPLLRDGQTIGVIGIARQRVEPFSERQIELVSTFADQAVIAIENARLLGELREALEQQTATAEVLQVINGSPGNLTPVFDAILEKAHGLCGATKGAFLTFDGEHFPVAATRGLSDAYTQILRSNSTRQVKAGFAADQISPRQQLLNGADLVHLVGQEVAVGPIGRAVVDLEGVRSVLFLPLRRDGRLLGYITAYREEEALFSEKQIAVLQNFAAQAVIAMENARLLTEQREALEQQTATAEVLQVINSSPGDLKPVFGALLEKAMRLCGAAFGSLYTYDGARFHSAAQLGVPAAYSEVREQTPPSGQSGGPATRILATNRTVHILDMASEDAYTSGQAGIRALVELGGARTILAVPLLKDGTVLGYISIYRQEVRAFSGRETALLENFADQAVIAMENARLLDELRARTAELARRNSEYGERIEHQSATIDVLKAISTCGGDDQPVLELIVRRARELCQAETTGVFSFNGELISIRCTDTVDIQSLEPYLRTFPRLPTRDYTIGRAILDRQIIEIDDADADPNLAAVVHAHRNRAIITLPFLVNDQVVGGMSIAVRQPGGLTESQKALARILAEQASIAIAAAATMRQLQDRTATLSQTVAELQALEEVLRAVNSSLDLQTVLSTIISRAVQLSDADEGTIYEFDEAQGFFVPKSGYGMSDDWLAQLRDRRIRIGETPLGRSAAARIPLHISNLAEEPDDESKRELMARGVRAMLAVPLLWEDKVIGGLVIRRHMAGGFGDSTATLLQTFAGQCVLAIENARLFRDAERERAAAETALADLRRTQDRLVQSEKMASLGQLTAGIAHEIKNPLNFVNNFAELSVDLLDELHDAVANNLATESDEIAALLKGNLARIAEHGRRADSIVKNMLLHSRSGPSEHRLVDLNAVVEEALNLAYHGARAETPGFNITMKRQLDPTIGLVEMFPQDFTRVMLNLIANGFYAARQRADRNGSGAFEPMLTLTTRDQGNQVEILVRDNGAGIASDIQEKIFEPFFTTKPAGEGTGLGLSLSYDIVVKQHGGQLIVDSRPNEFTEFRITLSRRLAANGGETA